MCSEEPTLARKVIDFLTAFMNKIKDVLSAGVSSAKPNTYKAQMERNLFNYLKQTDRIRDRFYKMMEAARRGETGTTTDMEAVRLSINPDLSVSLDRVLNDTFPKSKGEIEVGTVSNFMSDVIGVDSLIKTMPATKAYAAMVTEEEAKAENRFNSKLNYHGLGKDKLIEALESSEKPVVAFVSNKDENGKKRDDRIVLVTDVLDSDGNNIVVVEEVATNAIVNKKRIKANKDITAYGKDYIKNYIRDAITNNRILYYDKNKIGSVTFGEEVQFLNSKSTAYFKDNIKNFWGNVKYMRGENANMSSGEFENTALADAFKKAEAGNSTDKIRLSKTVEETKDLIAVHSLDAENLANTIELGGFPMPSIAIIRTVYGHDDFGKTTVLFDKKTIDPARKDNEVYSGDAWTPTFPAVYQKVDREKQKSIESKVINSIGDIDLYYQLQSRGLDYDNMS